MGNIVVGTVVSLEPNGALVEIGNQTLAYVPLSEMSINLAETPLEGLQLGEIREFLILSEQDGSGHKPFFLSIRKLEEKRTWERLRQMQAENVTVYSQVIPTDTNELLVKIEGVMGSIERSELSGNKLSPELIGEILPLQLLKVDEDNKCLILSYKKALLLSLVEQFKVGEVITGKILEVKHFGAFVDIGNAIALLRFPEMSHAHFNSPHDIFKVNEEVKAIIIDLDLDRGIISLSTKQLEPEPGDMLKNPQMVYEKASESAAKYRERILSQGFQNSVSNNDYN